MDKINKITIIFEILKLFTSRNDWLNTKTIKNLISNTLEEDIPERRIKQYLDDIQKHLNYSLDTKRGKDGGYKLSESTKKEIARISQLALSRELRNALNDSFEIAFKSQTFYYKDDLEKAINKLYLKLNLKDQDYEYYVGKKQNDSKTTKIIKELKEAAIERKWVSLSSKYTYFNLPKEMTNYKPLFIVHDIDESFVILKTEKGNYLYQNIKNIKELIVKDKKFEIFKEDIKNHINKHSLNVKGTYELSFAINSERGLSTYNLWHQDFEEISSKGNKKVVKFFEEYTVYLFLYRMLPYLEDLKVPEKIKNGWNNWLNKLNKI